MKVSLRPTVRQGKIDGRHNSLNANGPVFESNSPSLLRKVIKIKRGGKRVRDGSGRRKFRENRWTDGLMDCSPGGTPNFFRPTVRQRNQNKATGQPRVFPGPFQAES